MDDAEIAEIMRDLQNREEIGEDSDLESLTDLGIDVDDVE
jgi:hypothetical protein